MKQWKKAVLVVLCVGMLGSMTACAGKNRVNDATGGTNTGDTLDKDLKDGADTLEDGVENLKDDVEDGARDVKDGVEDMLDGDDTDNNNAVREQDTNRK